MTAPSAAHSFDLAGQLPHAWIRDARSFARQNGDGVMRDHRTHVGHVLHRRLAPNEPQRHDKHGQAPADDADVRALALVHAHHVRQHDDGHRRSHDQRHIGARLAEKDVIELVRIQVHQTEHDDG
jgi:hypothetical protein